MAQYRSGKNGANTQQSINMPQVQTSGDIMELKGLRRKVIGTHLVFGPEDDIVLTLKPLRTGAGGARPGGHPEVGWTCPSCKRQSPVTFQELQWLCSCSSHMAAL